MKRGQHAGGTVMTLLLLLFNVTARAQEPSDRAEGWTFVASPYVWFLSIGGNVTVRGRSAPADASFSELFDKLNFGFMGQLEARYGPFGVFVNPVYAHLSSDNTVGRTKVDTTVDTFLLDFGAYYRVGQWTLGDAPAGETPRVALEPYIGGRIFSVDTEISFTGPRDVDRKANKGQSWADPILGVRSIWELDNRWSVVIQADVGGFGASSDITWQTIGLAGYRFGLFHERDTYAFAGYRALHDNYTDGSFAGKSGWNVTLQGPVLGLAIAF